MDAETAAAVARYLALLVHGLWRGLLGLRELTGVTDEELESIYTLGYNLFGHGKLAAARDVFVGLTVHAPEVGRYWRALGAVHQQGGDLVAADAAYEQAIDRDPRDVVSWVYRAEVRLLRGERATAVADLEQVLELAGTPRAGPWVRRAALLLAIHAAPALTPRAPSG